MKNPLYIGKCTLTLAKAKRELEVPAIVSKTEFQKASEKVGIYEVAFEKKGSKKTKSALQKNL